MRATKGALTASFLLAAFLVAATGSAAAADQPLIDGYEDGALSSFSTTNYTTSGGGDISVQSGQPHNGASNLRIDIKGTSGVQRASAIVDRQFQWNEYDSNSKTLSVWTYLGDSATDYQTVNQSLVLKGSAGDKHRLTLVNNGAQAEFRAGGSSVDAGCFVDTNQYVKIEVDNSAGDAIPTLYDSSGNQVCSGTGSYPGFTPEQIGVETYADTSNHYAAFDDLQYGYTASTPSDTQSPNITNLNLIDNTDGDGTIENGDEIRFKADISDNNAVNQDSVNLTINPASSMEETHSMVYDSAIGSYTKDKIIQNVSAYEVNSFKIEAADNAGNTAQKSKSSHSLTFGSTSDNSTNDSNSTDNTTDNTTEYNITKLRDVPGEQSFQYLNSGDSTNISIENSTVTGDSNDAVYLTRQIRADKYDRIELDTSGSVTVEVLDAQNSSENESILKTETVSGMATVNISNVNTTGIQVRMKLDNGTEITDFKLYGDQYSGGLFGGGNLITGNFFGNIPVVGEFLSGLTAGVNNVISGILNVPSQMFEGIMEVIPSL